MTLSSSLAPHYSGVIKLLTFKKSSEDAFHRISTHPSPLFNASTRQHLLSSTCASIKRQRLINLIWCFRVGYWRGLHRGRSSPSVQPPSPVHSDAYGKPALGVREEGDPPVLPPRGRGRRRVPAGKFCTGKPRSLENAGGYTLCSASSAWCRSHEISK